MRVGGREITRTNSIFWARQDRSLTNSMNARTRSIQSTFQHGAGRTHPPSSLDEELLTVDRLGSRCQFSGYRALVGLLCSGIVSPTPRSIRSEQLELGYLKKKKRLKVGKGWGMGWIWKDLAGRVGGEYDQNALCTCVKFSKN